MVLYPFCPCAPFSNWPYPRDVFVKLLVECAKDFSLRSVPQVNLSWRESTEEARRGAGTASAESRRLAARCQAMVGWEQSDHAVVVFKQEAGETSGVEILSLNRNRRCGRLSCSGEG